MTATYTWDVFSTLDAYGSYGPDGDWGELLESRTFDGRTQLLVYRPTAH